MEFLSEKFALKSPPSKNSDFYMGAGGALEHVMETLDNESFYSKASAGKCVQAFGPLPRAEHHVRLDRTSPSLDSSGESPAPGGSRKPTRRSEGGDRSGPGGKEGKQEGKKEGKEGGAGELEGGGRRWNSAGFRKRSWGCCRLSGRG